MGQRIVRALAVCALAGVSLAPMAIAGASMERTAAAGTLNHGASTTPSPGNRQAWDEALKSAPHSVAGAPGPSGGSGAAATVGAAAASPAITVTPAADLVRGQVVSVTGSGFGADGVVLVECPTGVTPAFNCDLRNMVTATPDAAGAIDVSFTVHRIIEGSTGRIDCSSASDACDLVVADQNAAVLARHALAFDPNAPAPHPTITVTPSTGLLAGQSVTVGGTGFAAADSVRVSECATIDPFCSGANTFVTTDTNGAFSIPLTVRLRVSDGSGSATHCLAVACIVRAASNVDLEYVADAPITFDPNQPPPPVPSITVTPSTGLLHDQTVTVSGTGFDPSGFVEITECASDTSPFCGEYLTDTQLDATGAFTISANVSRLLSTSGPGGPSVVDCAVGPCSLNAIGFSGNESIELVANTPITFDGSVPPPPIPVVTVTPTTNLSYRAQVTVHGTGFSAGEFVYADFCADSQQSGGCGSSSNGTAADASGTVDFTLDVKRRVSFGGVEMVDCIDAGTQCSVQVQGQRSYERTQVTVTFDPNSPIPPPPTATATPDHDLGFRQVVNITGSGFPPGPTDVQQCAPADRPGPFGACTGFAQVVADANGAITGSIEVRRLLNFGGDTPFDCATSPQPCTLQIGSGDPDETATVPLGFDPNSQPPPPPVVVVSPSTHLLDGQQVTVGGLGFAAGATLGMAPCKAGVTAIADACDIGRAGVATAGANGAFLTTRAAAGVIQTAQGSVDCTTAIDACVLAVANAADLSEFATAAMSFDAPELMVHSATATEGTGDMTPAEVMVELSTPIGTPTTVEWQAIPGTAGTDDFMQTRGRVTIPAGATEAMIHVDVVGDAIDEPTERFTVQVISALGTRISDGTATVKIRDDDGPPSASIRDGRGREARGRAYAEVTLSGPSGKTIVVHYVTHHGSARSGTDYVRQDSELIFLPGETRHVIRVALVDDHTREPTESFRIELDRAENADVADDTGIVTITDDD
jgi:Neocarzinostatin family./Calx-beta domain.